MKKLSRREFLKRASLGAAGGYLGLSSSLTLGQMTGGGTGGGTGVIDPPPGALFRDPVEMPNVSTTPGVVEVNLEARIAPVNVNGVMANLLTYNGYYPAPTIRAKKGDLLRVNFTHSMPLPGTNILGHNREMTNLHTHGLHVSPQGNSDNMMLMFMMGDTFTYEYDLSKQDGGTYHFYHPHHHGNVAEQYWGGMAGALMIEDETNVLAGYETHLLVLKDITLSGADPEPYTMMNEYVQGKEGAVVMVNGQVNPVLPARPGQVQRWRILNASNARFYKLGLSNHTLQVIGTEGGLVDKPYPQSSVLLSPGERVDILVKANATAGNYKFLALPYARRGNMTSPQITLMTLSVSGAALNETVPQSINPDATRITATPAKTEQLVLSMGQGKGYINGITFTETSAYTVHSMLGTYEVWEIVNNSGMDHPFHQHVNACQVLSITGGDSSYASFLTSAPAWKDTVLVPKWGSVKILLPVMDYPGMAMFHCHIIEHEDIGMMGVWDIMDTMR
jgi:FtsP/CotA-like multicopper oxidase with cupredoxin domain